jgi:RNA recognition motif-containing protein
MGKKLYVGNLSFQSNEETLNQHFSQAGNVASVKIITDRETGRSRGFAFVEMSSDDEAQTAISKFNGVEFEGRALTVNEARPQEDRGGGGGGSRGGYGGGGGGRGGRGGYGNDRRSY